MDFTSIILMFLIGALSFAMALTYNNFAQSILQHYVMKGHSIKANLVNMLVFTGISVAILWGVWKANPDVVYSVVSPNQKTESEENKPTRFVYGSYQ